MAASLVNPTQSSAAFKELLKYRDLEDTFQDLEQSGRLARLESTFSAIYDESQDKARELKDHLKIIVGVMRKAKAVDEVWSRKEKEALGTSRTLTSSLSTREFKRSAESLRQSKETRHKKEQPLYSTQPLKTELRSKAREEIKEYKDYVVISR